MNPNPNLLKYRIIMIQTSFMIKTLKIIFKKNILTAVATYPAV